ncbi:M17 family metallopeptidase [Virgibacillus oceani]
MTEQINVLFSNNQKVKENNNLQRLLSLETGKDCFLTTLDDEIAFIVTIGNNNYELDEIRMLAGDISRELGKHRIRSGKVDLNELLKTFDYISKPELITAFVEGWTLGNYSFSKYKTRELKIETDLKFNDITGIESYIERGKTRANATAFTRDLVNETPEALNPTTFPKYLEKEFNNSNVDMKLLDEAEISKMHGVLAVNKGSKHPAAFIELAYCGDQSKPLTVLVGKGVTFDTGGISLKVRRNISVMKMDMAGAAAVAGAVKLLADTHAQVNVIGLIPVVENILGEDSYLPGDIITYNNNLSVEIGNTDAEGRLILADGLLRANEIGAEYVVDIATLTSSVKQALGNEMAGVFGDNELTRKIEEIGNKNGDFVWSLPLLNKYEKNIKSDYADICNISSGDGPGSIIAALFLRHFVKDVKKWLHIDMAGVKESDEAGYYSKSASGYGARLLADYAEYISNQEW